MIFKEWLKKKRKEMAMTQRKLAANLNVSEATILAYESGRRLPSFDTMHKIAQEFQVDVKTIAIIVETS
jgi:transcriptional regulator with XRE-family HTH domain